MLPDGGVAGGKPVRLPLITDIRLSQRRVPAVEETRRHQTSGVLRAFGEQSL
jgi:hypothetical protein